MPLTPEQLVFARKYQKYYWRWRENQDEDDMITVLARLVSPATLAEIEKDLEAHFVSAEADVISEFVTSIRKHAENLPDGHELKDAIQNIPKSP